MATRTEVWVRHTSKHRLHVEGRWGDRASFYTPLDDSRFASLALPNVDDQKMTTMDTDDFNREIAIVDLTRPVPARWTERVVNPWSNAAQIDAMMNEAD